MVVLKEQECYLWRITPSEKSMIHTDDGLRSVEVRKCDCIVFIYEVILVKIV